YFIAYDNVVANQEDLFSHFIEFVIGKRPASQTWDLTPGQRNLGANLRLREITRLLNHYVAEGGDTPGQWGRQYILANPNLLSELLPPDEMLGDVKNEARIPHQHPNTLEIEQQLTREYLRRFVNPVSDTVIFGEGKEEVIEYLELNRVIDGDPGFARRMKA